MTEPAVEVQARLNTADAKREAQSFGQQLEGSLIPSINAANIAAQALRSIGSAIKDAISASVGAALESEVAQNRLAAALRNAGDATDATLLRVQAFNESLIKKIGLDDDDTAAIQSKLLALGVSTSSLEAATKATIGLADATGKDATRAAREVARAFKEGGEEATRLENLFSIAEARATTLAGALRILNAEKNEFLEDIGNVVIQNDEIARAVKGAAENVELLRKEFADSKSPLNDAVTAVGLLAQNVNGLASAMIQALPTIRDTVQELSGVADILSFLDPLAFAKKSTGFVLGLIADEGNESRQRALEESGGGGPQSVGVRTQLADFGESGGTIEIDRRPKRRGVSRSSVEQGVLGFLGFDDATLAEGDIERQIQDKENRAATESLKRQGDFANAKREQRERELAAERTHLQELASVEDRRIQQERQFWGQIGGIVTGGVTNFIGQVALAAAAGKDIDLGEFFGKMLIQIGQSAMAMGAAAVAAATLGSIAPWLAPATGGPAGIGAGLALIAAGVTAIGIGAAMGGGGSQTPSVPTAGAAGGTSAPDRASAIPQGFNAGAREPTTTVINVNFGRGIITGTPREIGRTIRNLFDEESTLRNRRPALGGA